MPRAGDPPRFFKPCRCSECLAKEGAKAPNPVQLQIEELQARLGECHLQARRDRELIEQLKLELRLARLRSPEVPNEPSD